jgi:hypothetical protein
LHCLPCLERAGFHVLQTGQRNCTGRGRPGQARRTSAAARQRVSERPLAHTLRRWEAVGRHGLPCLRDESRRPLPASSAHVCSHGSSGGASVSGQRSAACAPLPCMGLRGSDLRARTLHWLGAAMRVCGRGGSGRLRDFSATLDRKHQKRCNGHTSAPVSKCSIVIAMTVFPCLTDHGWLRTSGSKAA